MKIRKSIFTKLIGSFVLYAIITVLTFIIYLALEATIIGNGDISRISPDSVIDENVNVVNLEIAQKIGGWVEELDEEYHIVKSYGEKKTDSTSYTMEEILEITSVYGETEHIGFFVLPENSSKRFLCIYERATMSVKPTIILNDLDEYGTVDIFPSFFLVSALEIILISLYLKKKIKNPLEKIIAGMEMLKAGDSSARINIKTEAEFEAIVDTFNVMAAQLETEKLEKEDMIQKKNQMLLELSHDIKTPIATIKSYANALEDELVPEEKRKSYYRTIDNKAERVQKLAEDMFIMLKMDNPKYELNLEKVNLCEYLRQICAEYYDEIAEAGFVFVIDIPETDRTAMVDQNLFARVIGNLLTNAKKYNKTGKEIELKLSEQGGRMVLTVSDDGEAIDKEFAGQMFSAFARGDKARKTDGGTGLGLAIAKIIVEKHGGNIKYSYENERNMFIVEI